MKTQSNRVSKQNQGTKFAKTLYLDNSIIILDIDTSIGLMRRTLAVFKLTFYRVRKIYISKFISIYLTISLIKIYFPSFINI